jgi:hypothetical protein
MKKNMLVILMVVALCMGTLTGCAEEQPQVSANSNVNPTNSPLIITTDDLDGDSLPNAVEKVYGTNPYTADTDGDGVNDKEDKDPAFTENPIMETSAAALPIEIKDVRVEDNATADHLEITLINTSAQDMSSFDIYFTITDKLDKKVEGYYVKLDGLTVKAGESTTIHFDNDLTQPGHYFGNMNGLYGTSANGLTFDIELHANGYAPMNFSVEKAVGTAEVAD